MYFFSSTVAKFYCWIRSNERNYDLSQATFRRGVPYDDARFIRFWSAAKYPHSPSHRPHRFLQALLQLRYGLAATPVLFELTSFTVMRENRYGYTAYPTSYKWRLFRSLSASVYTTALVHRYARLSSGRYGSDKVLGDPTSFAERGTGRKDEIGESKSGMDDGRTRRDERGSSVVIARVMLPVSLLLLPLLSSRLCRCRCCCYCC